MTIPSGYTADELAAYMHGLLTQAKLDTLLHWVVPDSYAEMITDVMFILGVSDLSVLTTPLQMRQLRAAARVALWRSVKAGLTLAYDFSDSAVGGSGSWSRSQITQHVDALLAQAERDAASVGVDVMTMPPARVYPVEYPEDPYAPGRWLWPFPSRRTP